MSNSLDPTAVACKPNDPGAGGFLLCTLTNPALCRPKWGKATISSALESEEEEREKAGSADLQ